MSDHESRQEICPDCQATADNRDARIISVGEDPESGRMFTTTTYHHSTCPTYTVNQILMEDGVRRAKEQAEWAKEAFPAAVRRFRAASAAIGPNIEPDVARFVDALKEAVEIQAGDTRRVITMERWAEILDKHFPPAEEGPVGSGQDTT